ncbi:MAG: peptide chain release factor N(5)-glutamine methyltransferase [Chloroflexi bacterium]|nr:peptide chain release factor N(5)-glutamine methyltransferase [Chloroflexota bacterium]
MNVKEALLKGRRLLESIGSDEAPLEAELLLRHALSVDRVHLYQRLNDDITPRQEHRYHRFLDRRLAREPTAYITGHREFFGLEFEVAPAALIPRPETEVLVEIAIDFIQRQYADQPITVADVGAGSGAIAVALAHTLPNINVIATDTSKRALKLAERNAARHGVTGRIEFVHGNLLAPLDEPIDVIASNLPYVRTSDWEALPPEIRGYEPKAALDGGVDGLRLIRRLLKQAPQHLKPGGALFAEIGDEQGPLAEEAANTLVPNSDVHVRPDLAELDRVLCVYA